MTLYLIRELQHVVSERLVEAPDEGEALAIFWGEQGEFCGTPTNGDGDVTDSTLLGIEEVAKPSP